MDNEELGRSVASDQEVDEIDQQMLESLRFSGFQEEDGAVADEREPAAAKKKSRKEIYEEVIKKSKKAKADRQEFQEDYLDAVRDLDEEVLNFRDLLRVTKKIKVEDPHKQEKDDYYQMAAKLSTERMLGPTHVEKKVDNKAIERKKKKIVNELNSDSDDCDKDAGVDGLRDNLRTDRKFRDNEHVNNQKKAKKLDKTLDYLKNLNDGSGDDSDADEDELSELDLDEQEDSEGEEESGSQDYVDYENIDQDNEELDDEEGSELEEGEEYDEDSEEPAED